MGKATVLGHVEAAEAELARARLAADDARHRISSGDRTIDAGQLAVLTAAEEYASLAVEGARVLDHQAAVEADLARGRQIIRELRDDKLAARAGQLAALADAVEAAVTDLLDAAGTYTAEVAQLTSEAAGLAHRPDELDVQPAGLRGGIVTVDGHRFAVDRDLGADLAMVAVAAAAGNAGAPHPTPRDSWADWASRAETIWSTLAAAHPGVDLPSTPGLDARRRERAEQRRRERDFAENRRRRTAGREAVRLAHAAARVGDGAGVHAAVTSGYWPAGEPLPDGYTPRSAPPEEPSDRESAAGRPRRSRTPHPSDDPPPKAA